MTVSPENQVRASGYQLLVLENQLLKELTEEREMPDGGLVMRMDQRQSSQEVST